MRVALHSLSKVLPFRSSVIALSSWDLEHWSRSSYLRSFASYDARAYSYVPADEWHTWLRKITFASRLSGMSLDLLIKQAAG